MAPALPRTSFHGPRLVRLLAALADVEVTESRQTVAERLGDWLAWTDAIALSSVLNSPAPPAAAGAGAAAPARVLAEFQHLRRDLAQRIVRETAAASPDADRTGTGEADAADWRSRYLAQQQVMDQRIGALRAQVRRALAGRSPDLGRLAALDTVLDQALGGRERQLLAQVPALLERHLERLRQAVPVPAPSDPWPDQFRRDLQAVLLAELEVRLQPVEGMLEAMGLEAPTQQGNNE